MTSPAPLVPPSPLQHLQQQFAIIDLSGELRLIDQQQIAGVMTGSIRGEPAFYKKADGNLIMRRHLETLPIHSNPKSEIENFWNSPATTMYTSTSFDPRTTSNKSLNFWIGPTANPASGNWVLIRDYLRDVICDGNSVTYEYLIRYLAHMIQHPEEKPGVMLVLLGGQGTGKGMYFNLLRAIWPRTTLQVSKIDQVVGRFTSALERNYIICMDEALFAGDRQAIDNLKSIVTEQHLHIEGKYQPSRTIESFHRLFAASNHEHFAHVESDDRRFVFLRVSDYRQKDTVYFSGIAKAIADPKTISAILYYLTKKDLSQFNVRDKPQTTEQLSQKIKSLQGFERFWYEVLSNTDQHKLELFDEWQQSIFISTASLIYKYKLFNTGSERYQPLQSSQILETIKRLCPSAQTGVRETVTTNDKNEQLRGVRLPKLAVARDEFSAYLGQVIAWDEIDGSDDASDVVVSGESETEVAT
ncbi:MAG: hypothetical protein RL078_1790 [Bacteroidota bacterium]|jgi:hypothetical protein